MIIGAHLSTKDGFGKLPENALVMGLKTYQFFSKNQMQWKSKPLNEQEARKHFDEIRKRGIRSPAIHASYLLNLCSPEDDKFKRSYDAFLDEIRRADQLGVKILIFHPGAHMGSGIDSALRRLSGALESAIGDTSDTNVVLTIENTAAQGSMVGYSIDQLSTVYNSVADKKRIGFCIDTCHAFQAGYDLNNELSSFISEFDSEIGLSRLKAFHLNDSKYPFNKHLDRHANLGQGNLSKDFFISLFNEKKLREIPAYLETPGGEEGYPNDLKYLKALGIAL